MIIKYIYITKLLYHIPCSASKLLPYSAYTFCKIQEAIERHLFGKKHCLNIKQKC